jgi:hypothetical protein
VRQALEEQNRERERLRNTVNIRRMRERAPVKSIDVFRCDTKYGGDGTRIDMAYAIYAFSCGVSEAEVIAAIRTRDLSHKGNQKRQDDYVNRTIKKAAAALEMVGRTR